MSVLTLADDPVMQSMATSDMGSLDKFERVLNRMAVRMEAISNEHKAFRNMQEMLLARTNTPSSLGKAPHLRNPPKRESSTERLRHATHSIIAVNRLRANSNEGMARRTRRQRSHSFSQFSPSLSSRRIFDSPTPLLPTSSNPTSSNHAPSRHAPGSLGTLQEEEDEVDATSTADIHTTAATDSSSGDDDDDDDEDPGPPPARPANPLLLQRRNSNSIPGAESPLEQVLRKQVSESQARQYELKSQVDMLRNALLNAKAKLRSLEHQHSSNTTDPTDTADPIPEDTIIRADGNILYFVSMGTQTDHKPSPPQATPQTTTVGTQTLEALMSGELEKEDSMLDSLTTRLQLQMAQLEEARARMARTRSSTGFSGDDINIDNNDNDNDNDNANANDGDGDGDENEYALMLSASDPTLSASDPSFSNSTRLSLAQAEIARLQRQLQQSHTPPSPSHPTPSSTHPTLADDTTAAPPGPPPLFIQQRRRQNLKPISPLTPLPESESPPPPAPSPRTRRSSNAGISSFERAKARQNKSSAMKGWMNTLKRLEDAKESRHPLRLKPRRWVLARVAEIYRDKMIADSSEDRIGLGHVSFQVFIYEWFIHEYGLRTLAESNLVAFLQSILAYASSSEEEDFAQLRLSLFAQFAGIGRDPSETYHLDVLNIYLALLRILLPTPGVSLDTDKEGRVPVSIFVDALTRVFVYERGLEEQAVAHTIATSLLPNLGISSSESEYASLDAALGTAVQIWCSSFDETHSRMMALFHAADCDGNGTIELKEFIQILRHAAPLLTQQEAHAMFLAAAGSESGSLGMAEFAKATRAQNLPSWHPGGEIREADIADRLQELWRDTREELESQLASLAKHLPDHDNVKLAQARHDNFVQMYSSDLGLVSLRTMWYAYHLLMLDAAVARATLREGFSTVQDRLLNR